MGARDHVVWIFGSALVGLAVEGFQGIAGEAIAHSIGAQASAGSLIGAVLIGWAFSAYDGAKVHRPIKPGPKRMPKAKPKARRKH